MGCLAVAMEPLGTVLVAMASASEAAVVVVGAGADLPRGFAAAPRPTLRVVAVVPMERPLVVLLLKHLGLRLRLGN